MAFPDEDIDQVVSMPEIDVEEGEEGDGVDDLPPTGESSPVPPTVEPLHSFGIHIEHDFDEGIRCAPRAGPAGTRAAVWRSHGGLAKRTVIWEAVAVGKWPTVPHPAPACSNDVLLSKKVVHGVPFPGISPDSWFYRIAGQYVYLLANPPADGDVLAGAKHPLSNAPAAINTIRIDQFDKNLLHALNPAKFSEPEGGLARLATTGQS